MNEEQLREFREAAETLMTTMCMRFPDTTPERMKDILDEVMHDALHDRTTPLPELTMRMMIKIYAHLSS